MPISFQQDQDGHIGTGPGGREWRIRPTFTGWRLEFCDRGDTTPTNAGVFPNLEAAKAEANRVPSQSRRR